MQIGKKRSLGLIAFVAGLACSSGGGGGNGPQPVSVTGVVRDYFTGNALAGVLLAGGGGAGTTMSGGTGGYTFASVPANSNLEVTASLTGYRTTRNVPIAVGTTDLTANLAIVATADVNRQYTTLAITPAAGAAALFIELEDDGGQPRVGIPLSDITLVDGNDDPVGDGPYVFGAAGDLVSPGTLSVTTAFGGRSRIGFLNVPAGRTTLRVEVSTPNPETLSLALQATTDGVTLGLR